MYISGPTEFELDLKSFMEGLSIKNHEQFIEDVDFTQVSPMVQLIHTVPGT